MAALHFVYFHDKDLSIQIVNEWVIKSNSKLLKMKENIEWQNNPIKTLLFEKSFGFESQSRQFSYLNKS